MGQVEFGVRLRLSPGVKRQLDGRVWSSQERSGLESEIGAVPVSSHSAITKYYRLGGLTDIYLFWGLDV